MSTARRDSRLIRVGPSYVPVIANRQRGARIGESPLIRVWGRRCVDEFSRTVVDGWGDPDWCLGPWSMAAEPGDGVWVDDGDALLQYTTPWGLPQVWVTTGATLPGRIRLKSMWIRGTAGFDCWIAATARAGNQDSFFTAEVAQVTGTGAPLEAYVGRYFGGPGVNASSWASVGVPLPAYYWIDHLVDEYGFYVRVWRDGEDEFSHLAPAQPRDTWGVGCPQGHDERWTSWDAWSDRQTPGITGKAFISLIAYASSGAQIYDSIEFLEGFCPCG